MQADKGYKTAIVILLCVIALQWFFLAQLLKEKPPAPRPVALPPAAAYKGKIAIVLDDWGYNRKNLIFLKTIHAPLTLSILPHLPYTHVIAADAHTQGFEVILHLPMEPHEKLRLEQDTILVSMDATAIRSIAAKDIDDIYYAKGVSNHMGSKATEDARVMSILFGELKKRHMYFLDSAVSSKSACADAATAANIPFAKRDIFLDNTEEPVYIKGQILKLAKKASLYKKAIGIGHDRKVTLEVLREAIPELERQGYKFVYLSELVR